MVQTSLTDTNDNVDGDNDNDEDNDADDDDNGDEKEEEDDDDDDDDGEYDDDDDDDDDNNDDVSTSSLEILLQQQTALIETLQTRLTAAENKLNDVEGRVRAHDGLYAFFLSQVSVTPATYSHLHIVKEESTLELVHSKADDMERDDQAPVGGVYSFFLTEMSAPTASQHSLYLAIVKEGAVLDYVYAEGSDSNEEGSSQVTTHLAAGQQPNVAFTVRFAHDSGAGLPLTAHATLVFDKVVSNIGNGYDSRTEEKGHDLKRTDDVSVASLQTLVQQQAALIQTMQADLTAAKHRLSTLEHGFHTHDTKISNIQQKQAQAEEKGHDIKRTDDVSVSSLQTLVQQQTALIQTMQADLTAAKHRLSTLEHGFHTHDTKISGIQQKQAEAAAFSVRFANDDSSHGIPLTAHSTLKFDKIIYNLGNGYDTRTGIFTAPVTGVYAFFLNAMSVNSHHALKLQIMKETTWLDIAYAEGGTDVNDQGSTEVTTHIKAGQQVWVRQYSGDAVRGGYYTIFTGYLLHAD
nr:hypothetical protein BaRGS_029893 [Batillaria attramentaria]